jgi:hypothetical protein
MYADLKAKNWINFLKKRKRGVLLYYQLINLKYNVKLKIIIEVLRRMYLFK